MRSALHAYALLVLVALLAACPGTRRQLVPDYPKNGDAQARSKFHEARAKFLKDGRASDAFKEIVEEYPDDPIVPWAQLYAGMSALKDRKLAEADAALREVIAADKGPGLTARAELFLGITKNYQGDTKAALELLRRAERAIEGDAERLEYQAALAYATAAGEQPLASLSLFDQLWKRATPTERALIVARVEEVVAGADPKLLARGIDQLDDRKGPAMAAVASRLALVAEGEGRAADARRFRELADPARAAVGLPRTITAVAPAAGGAGAAGLVGAVLPFGGKANLVADAAGAGLGLAAGATGGKGAAAIEVRAAEDPDGASLAIENLAKANVVAVVLGVSDGAAVDAAAARAESLGLPLLTLHPQPDKRTTGRYVFHLWHPAVQRARILARRALAKGVKEFAVLAPDSPYGRGVTAAFTAALEAGGGKVVKTVTYPTTTKSFKAFTDKLGDSWKGVFIPDNASMLALAVPALAASGHMPAPAGTKKGRGSRPVLLASTIEGLDGRYMAEAGRYSEGALLAPGYYPDDQDPASKQFLDDFIAAYGRAPKATEAYAYDAAQLAGAAVGGRAALAAALAGGTMTGLTGAIQFDANHLRADDGVIYTVVEDGGVYSVRAAK
ncbi:MAG TPA: penicillin-binding protein activator [Kofleriaceae bacterium]|nr:penicillin-binding protein activator [Kofleriaceae bacterium]